ncbi:MAG TPA: hypothetical protein VJ787_06395 [Thermoleophilia bacterium]|nr:hypothetical protein [Thermoleophilia bacterium]
MTRRFIALMGLLVFAVAVLAPAALASDHLFNAANAPGADQRGFGNPVALNPSGVSGPAARPATVPGEGNPNAGQDQTTPAADLTFVSVRSGGHGGASASQ